MAETKDKSRAQWGKPRRQCGVRQTYDSRGPVGCMPKELKEKPKDLHMGKVMAQKLRGG